MSRSDEYKEAKKGLTRNDDDSMLKYYQSVEDRPLPDYDRAEIEYDDQRLIEYFEDKVGDENEFQLRTEKYFTDSTLADKKRAQYLKYANNVNNITDNYSARFRNHYAWKRKRSASAASKNFRLMKERMQAFEGFLGDRYQKYLRKEEIMKYRLEGMLCAAEVKSKSAPHEKYLKGRAKISCNMLLRDQLEHDINEETNQAIKARLQNKLTSVERKISSAQKEVKDSIKSTQQTWQEEHRINDRTRIERRETYRRDYGNLDDASADLLFNLETFQDDKKIKEAKNKAFQGRLPGYLVLEDRVGNPINMGEYRRKQLNEKYSRNIKSDYNDVRNEVKEDAIKRFMRMPLPKPSDLSKKKLAKYITDNLRDYYELTKIAGRFYSIRMTRDGFVSDYSKAHPEFIKRLYYVEAVNKYVDYALRRYYSIAWNGKSFGIESDDRYKYRKANGRWTRDEVFGQGRETAMYEQLKAAYRTYQNPHEYINYIPMRIADDASIIDDESDERANAMHLIKDDDYNMIMERNRQEEENDAGSEDSVFLRRSVYEKYEIGDKKDDDNASVDSVFLGKDHFKKEDEDKISIKEESRVKIVEKDHDESYEKIHEKEIFIVPENAPAPTQEGVLKATQNVGKLKNVYKNFIDGKVNPYMFGGDAGKTLDRSFGFMIKFARFDEKGIPETVEDEKNHNWNLEFLATMEKEKEDPVKMGKMIAEYLPHVYDDIELPPQPERFLSTDAEQTEYRKQLDDWCDRLIRSGNLDKFLYKASLTASVDVMKKTIPGFEEYLSLNPQFVAYNQVLTFTYIYLNKYIAKNYHVATNLAIKMGASEIRDAESTAEENMKLSAHSIGQIHVQNGGFKRLNFGEFDQSRMKEMSDGFAKALNK